ncbi:CRAL/TRIO domain-containing protein [Nemania sp. FL0031]|nr:CRAL/TRIO domain-containing protein [Nemania sp. FL0031]
MAADPLSQGTLGNLTSDEEQKLQETWIHLLRLCGVDNLEKAVSQSSIQDLTSVLQQHISGRSPESIRRGFWDTALMEHPDALMLRFLRARKWDVEKAMVMLVSAINWRLERNLVDTVIRAGEGVGLKEHLSADDEGFIAQYRSGKSFMRGTDRENRLVYVIKVRLHFPSLQSGEAMETYVLHNIESLRVCLKPPNDKCCLIFDLTGFGVRNMDFHVVKFLVSVFEARYPETLGIVLIHNAPFVFWGIWNMIKGWLDPVIASKINFTRKPADLLQYISEENLQTCYGGTDAWEYEYVEPIAGENAKLNNEEKKTEIEQERGKLVREFELETIRWASLPADASSENEKASRRIEIADQLGENYWKLDPYIRARTYYHRIGMARDN